VVPSPSCRCPFQNCTNSSAVIAAPHGRTCRARPGRRACGAVEHPLDGRERLRATWPGAFRRGSPRPRSVPALPADASPGFIRTPQTPAAGVASAVQSRSSGLFRRRAVRHGRCGRCPRRHQTVQRCGIVRRIGEKPAASSSRPKMMREPGALAAVQHRIRLDVHALRVRHECRVRHAVQRRRVDGGVLTPPRP